MEDEATLLLRQVFGDSSDDDDDDDYYSDHEGISRPEIDTIPVAEGRMGSSLRGNPSWEGVNEIRGLWICRDFLSPAQQLSLLSAIHDEGWFLQASHNQAMQFGSLPGWADELSHSIREAVLSGDNHPDHKSTRARRDEEESLFPILPLELLGREPLFDQLIGNVYHPGQGICAHVDLLRFDDGIAIISLESPCVMHFTPASSNIPEDGEEEDHERLTRLKVPVYLSPGSLVIMSGEARYSWKHEINRNPGFQVWDGEELEQHRRISLTLRKLAQVE